MQHTQTPEEGPREPKCIDCELDIHTNVHLSNETILRNILQTLKQSCLHRIISSGICGKCRKWYLWQLQACQPDKLKNPETDYFFINGGWG